MFLFVLSKFDFRGTMNITKYTYILFIIFQCFTIESQLICHPTLDSTDHVCFTEALELSYADGVRAHAKGGLDMNGDGWDDVVRITKNGILITINENQKQSDVFFPIKIQVPPVWSIAAGDLNNDGFNDLVFGGQNRVSFLIYNADENNYIEQVMPESILSQRTTLFDINNDGLLDALICNDVGENLLYRNLGEGLMINDQSLITLSKRSGNYSAIWTDLNNDHHNDLYISKCKINAQPGDPVRTNLLYLQKPNHNFIEAGSVMGLDDNAQTWTTVFEDFNNDGWVDAFIANHDMQNKLMANLNGQYFIDTIQHSGIDAVDLGAFENLAVDINNDGFIDILSDLKNELYLNQDSFKFKSVDLPFKPSALLDFNRDGFLDILSQRKIFISKDNGNHWLSFQLHGLQSNRNGIGAKVEIRHQGIKMIREIKASQGYSPANTLLANFGLGSLDKIDSAIIYWPSGIQTILTDLSVNKKYEVPESSCVYFKNEIKVFEDYICNNEIKSILPHADETNSFLHPLHKHGIDSIASPGVYQLYYQNNQCTAVGHRYIIKKADEIQPLVNVETTTRVFCHGDTLHLNSNIDNKVIQWSNGNIGNDLSVSESGLYWFIVDSTCTLGQMHSDTVEVIFNKVADIDKVIINESMDSIFVMANGNNCKWYSDVSDVEPMYVGCNVSFPIAEIGSIIYLENEATLQSNSLNVGKIDTSGFVTTTSSPNGLYFTAKESFILDSVTMYVLNEIETGFREIQLLDENGVVIRSTEIELKSGENKVALHFMIEKGKFGVISKNSSHTTNIGLIDYPFPLGGFGSIDASFTGENFYPDFFNWVIKATDFNCKSARQAVLLEANHIDNIDNNQIIIFPNPAFDEIRLSGITENLTFNIFNVLGQHLLSDFTSLKNNSISLVTLPPGFYLLKIEGPGVRRKTFSFYKI